MGDEQDKPMLTHKILIVDDDDLVRIGLRTLLEAEAQFEVIAEACDGREALRTARKLEPDIVVMDVSMPDMNGVDATERICAALDGVRVLALSVHREGDFVRRMLAAGAVGYLPKARALDEIVSAIHAVAAGRTYISPDVTAELLTSMSNTGATRSASALQDLSVREREVLQLLAEGHSAGQIAASLNLSVKTTETHRRRMMQKLSIGSVAELTRFAIKHGISALD